MAELHDPRAQNMADQGPLAGGPGDAGANPAAGAAPGPRRSAAGFFFGVVLRPRTWLNLLYLALSFPLGLFYFVFLVVCLAVGVGLVIIWVGIFVLGLTAAAWWAFASFERSLADGLLGTHLQPAPRPWRAATGTWPRIKAHFGSLATWKDLAFLFLKFPLGLASFCVIVTLGALSLALLTAPLYYSHVESGGAGKVVTRGIDFGAWHVDRLWEALLLVPLGALLGIVSLHAFNGLAAVWRALARGLLETAGAPQQPQPAPAGGTDQPPLAPLATPGWGPYPSAPPPAAPSQPPSQGWPYQQPPAQPSPYQGQPPYPDPSRYPPPAQYPGWSYPPQPVQPPQQTYPPQPAQPSPYPPPPWGQWPSLYGPPGTPTPSPGTAPQSPGTAPQSPGVPPTGLAPGGDRPPLDPTTPAGERLPAEAEDERRQSPEEERP